MATTIVTKNGTGAPTDSDLVAGELAVDLTNGRLYTTDLDTGGTVLELGTNPASDVTFGDNTKAIFGAGSDLQIYHDGTDSIISESGVGSLDIRGTNVEIKNAAGTEYCARFITNDKSSLYYDGSEKLATTATGIDVTGTVTADGLTLQTSEDVISWASGNGIVQAPSNLYVRSSGTGDVILQSDSKQIAKFEHGGDISFYEDTGTTAKLFWDASAESLGIGTSSPVRNLHISSASAEIMLEDSDGGSDDKRVTLKMNNGIFSLNSRYDNDTERLSNIFVADMGSGNVGIGDDNPLSILHIGGGSDANVPVTFAPSTGGNAEFRNTSSTGTFTFTTNNGSSEAMRISGGNLLVGKTVSDATTDGIQARGIGAISIARSSVAGDGLLILNKKTNDGTIAEFRKDGATVGSIGSYNGVDLYIGDGEAGVKFSNDNNSIIPWNTSSNASRDNNTDLGGSSDRFRDLYLSGNINASTIISSGGRNSLDLQAESAGIGRVEANDAITVADDATLTLTDAECGAVLVHVYDNNEGDGAVFFASYYGGTTIIHAEFNTNFATSDVDGKYCLFKSSGSPTVTFKNRTGSAKSMTFMLVGAQAAKN